MPQLKVHETGLSPDEVIETADLQPWRFDVKVAGGGLRVGRLHDLRNRVAHHEPLLNTDVAARLADLLGLAKRLDPQLGQHVLATSSVASLLAARP